MFGHADSARKTLVLLDLPNEILIHILYNFDTLPLLNFRAVSHRIQNLIIRLVHSRLMRAASLEDRKLILECYHPSAQFTEPYLFCDYLGTPGLSDNIVGRGSIYERADALTREGMLNRLYSRFRPTSRDSDPTSRRPHPAGDIPGSRTSDAAISSRRSDAGIVKHNVSLDAHENFSQLLFNTSLVQIGPRRGVFSDIVPVIEKKTFRVFRQWLAEGAQETKEADRNTSRELPGEMESTNGKSYGNSETVWLDEDKKTAGFKIRIEERKWRRETPILLHKDEEQAVSYSLELNELHISTIHLLLAVEKHQLESENNSGKAMIFGSFAAVNTQGA